MSLLSWSRVYGSGRQPHSTTSNASPGSRNAPLKEDMTAGTLDRVVDSVATQLMLATARMADEAIERVRAHLVEPSPTRQQRQYHRHPTMRSQN